MRGTKKSEPVKTAPAAQAAQPKSTKAAQLTPVVFLQYQGSEVDSAALVEAAKEAFLAQNPGQEITELKLYWKPEDYAAYYVVNGSFDGKIDL